MDRSAMTAQPHRYRMRERLFDLGEDYSIKDETGEAAYWVDGQVLTLKKTFLLKDPSGRVLARIREPLFALRETVVIERENGPTATVRRALLSLLRPRYHVELADGDLEIAGDLLGHEYTIRRDGQEIARISRRWFSLRDSYGVEVAPGEDAPLLLAIAVALEAFEPGE